MRISVCSSDVCSSDLGALWHRCAGRQLSSAFPESCAPRRQPTGAVMNYFNQFAFQIYPYIPLAVFFIGSWVRLDKSMYTWRTGSSQLLSDKGMRVGRNLFHIGILAILRSEEHTSAL